MKTRLILFILLFISGFAIAGCKQQNQYRPDAKIVAAFNNKYPQADKVEWEQKQGYYVRGVYRIVHKKLERECERKACKYKEFERFSGG